MKQYDFIDFSKMHDYESYSANIMLEYRTSLAEGKKIEHLKPLFEAVASLEPSAFKEKLCDDIFYKLAEIPVSEDFPYHEPSELDEIKAARRKDIPVFAKPEDKELALEKIKGAWIGRVAGCLLGKPVECWTRAQIHELAKRQDNFPITKYLKEDIEYIEQEKQWNNKSWIDTINGVMPMDDDTNYTALAALKIVGSNGRNFTSDNVLTEWTVWQSRNAYCTAERVAYKNHLMGMYSPNTARYKNAYREYIDAQIRGDYFGYINPGNCEMAAEMAWRDAYISHVKNGIYGEMYIAAMLAAAAVSDDILTVIDAGIAQIPEKSRLYKDICITVDAFKAGKTYDEFLAMFDNKYNESMQRDWCFTNANAMLVTAALLYGGKDFGKVISLGVMPGFDTDCNGATAGSIFGMMYGEKAIDEYWVKPFNKKFTTAIFGYEIVDVDDMAELTMKHIEW